MAHEELTLEALYRDHADSPEYTAARAAKLAEIKAWIIDMIKDPNYLNEIAEACLSSAEEMGRIHGDDVSFEIAARYSIDGNPQPITL